MSEARLGRAAFLSVVGLGGLGLVAGGRIAGAASRPFSSVGSIVPSAVKDLVPDGWRIYAVNPPWPSFHAATYRLEVAGLVDRPLALSWPEIRALAAVRQTSDFHCVTGWTVGSVHWEGIRFSTLWEMARPRSDARYVNFISMEQPYADTLTLHQTMLPNVMLAHSMDGGPLSRAHGAPLRLVIPEMYGYKNVKWVQRIEVVSRSNPGFWEQRGYDIDAWVGRSNGY